MLKRTRVRYKNTLKTGLSLQTRFMIRNTLSNQYLDHGDTDRKI